MLDRVNQFVGHILALGVSDFEGRERIPDGVGDGVNQMRLAKSGIAVNQQRIVIFRRHIGDVLTGGVGQFIGRSDDEIIKRVIPPFVLGLRADGFRVKFLPFRRIQNRDLEIQRK